ncbi:MAG: cation transporter [Omnitrophica bacterium RBG_13_46_9]|nr:MAG: cation transporter [Omnitrophica bacterium RBG_13_46_9]
MADRTRQANDITVKGLLVNIILTFFKFIAGVAGKSAAMIADAFHSLSDIATDIVVLLGIGIASKPKDKTHDYGHGKVETLATTIIGFALLVVGAKIFWMGVIEIVNSYRGNIITRPGWVAFFAAVISIAVKECLYQYATKVGKAINSQAVIANAWHHRSDALSSIGTMLGIGGAIIFGEKWRILDPIAAIIVSLLIAKVGIDISLASTNELIDASLSEEIESKILETIRSVPGVKSSHNMKTRKIGNAFAIDVHIKVDKSLNITKAHLISTKVEDKIKSLYGKDTIVSVHIEPSG